MSLPPRGVDLRYSSLFLKKRKAVQISVAIKMSNPQIILLKTTRCGVKLHNI